MFSWRLLGIATVPLLTAVAVGWAGVGPPGVLRQGFDKLSPAAQGGAAIAATPVVREFPITTNPYTQTNPAISGNVVVWEDLRNDPACDPYMQLCNHDIYGRNLSTGNEFAVVTQTARQNYPSISGNVVVWEDGRHGTGTAIYGKNLSTGVEFPVVTRPGQSGPAIRGSIVAWVDTGYIKSQISGKNLATGVEFRVSNNLAYNMRPAVSGNVVAWELCSTCRPFENRDIWAKDLATGSEFPITTHPAIQSHPAFDGNIIVWQDWRAGNYDIYGKDLATGREFAVVTHPAQQMYPAISGNVVVWQDDRNGNADIYGKNLVTGEEFAIVTDPTQQGNPAVSGNIVVWMDERNGNADIYGARLERPPAPGACSLTGTVRGQSGSYYLEDGGRLLAFLYGDSVNFPAYLGQRVTVGGPCRVWRESAGPRPVFLAQTIISAAAPTGPPAKPPKGASRGW